MSISFNVPSSPKKSIETIDEFLGVDFTNSPANVDIRRSPNAVNMIRDVPGKVRKCMGWEVVKQYANKTEYNGKDIRIESNSENLSINNLVIQANAEPWQNFQYISIKNNDVIADLSYGNNNNRLFIDRGNFIIDEPTHGDLSSNKFSGMKAILNDESETDVCDEICLERNTIIKRIFKVSNIVYQNFDLLLKNYGPYFLVSIDTLGGVFAYSIYNIGSGMYMKIVNENGEISEQKAVNNNYLINEVGPIAYIAFYRGISYNLSDYVKEQYTEFKKFFGNANYSCNYDSSFYCYTDTNVKVNGYHSLHGDDDYLIHVGNTIWKGNNALYENANDERSKSWQFKNKLYIVDGKKMLVYHKPDAEGDWIIEPVENIAYIPTVTISKDPEGGGTPYEDLNLLNPAFTETFVGKEGVLEYNLSFDGLDATNVEVEIMDSDGNFVKKTEGTDFSVNRTTGVITFISAPGESPLRGEDNVKITAYRTVEGYSDRINKCTIGTLFGVNGALDRLFLSGNPDYINYDWYSGQYDPTYFEDTAYSVLGSDSSAIVGYSIISNYLATHKDSMEKDQNIILRQGDLQDSEPVFRIVNTLQGSGAVSKYSFAYLATEPLFLTKSGIYAVTAQDITGEKYAQNRSFYLNGKLLDENNLKDAFGIVYNDMYMLCVNDKLYILDGLQPVMTDKSMPYATRQYCAFYRENVPAYVMWEKDGALWFGTRDGRICRFHTNKDNQSSYNDDGNPIISIWETPDIDGKLFYKNKSLRYLAVRLQSAVATSMLIYVMQRGVWEYVKRDESFARYFCFSQLSFSKLSFSTDRTPKICSTKMRIKKVDKFRIRLMNDSINEPFSIFDIAMEYVENGNFKG